MEIPRSVSITLDRNRGTPIVIASAEGGVEIEHVAKTNPDSLRVRAAVFDERFGPPRAREALLAGEDPDVVMDRETPTAVQFQQRTVRYRMYR